jgi:hypothetical protein
MTIIEKIHNEFDTAEQRLLNQAQAIIEENSKVETNSDLDKILDKASRLEALGFTSTPENVIIDKIRKKRNKKLSLVVHNQEEAKLIQYYQSTYPFLKFLTEEELDRICKKYKLIYAPVDRYTKSVPEKNLKEIEGAQRLQHSDQPKSLTFYKPKSSQEFHPGCTANRKIRKQLANGFTVPQTRGWTSIEEAAQIKFGLGSYYRWGNIYYDRYDIDKSGLFIAAPKKHFDLKGLKSHTKFGYARFQLIVPKDPIVFRYVKGGIQVLSKWGDEADDIALQNAITN